MTGARTTKATSTRKLDPKVAASQEKTALALSKRLGQPAPPQKKKSDRSGSRIDASSRAGDQSHLLCTDQENTPDDELITVGDTTFVAPPTALPLSARASTASSAKKPNSSGSKRRSSIAEAKNFSKSSNKKPDASITDFKLLSKSGNDADFTMIPRNTRDWKRFLKGQWRDPLPIQK